MIRVIVEEQDFCVSDELRLLTDTSKGIGGINSFTGYVRDQNVREEKVPQSSQVDQVSSLFLEHYPGMTEKQIVRIIENAFVRWDLIGVTVIHRVGELTPGEQIVFVAVASAHRGTAFEACEFIIDYLKTEATFWKREQSNNGSNWLTTKASDKAQAKSWQ